ncbi:hypothetical protein NIES2101_21095 [Calothrix sp. HK-06]|nr:hypothetical protein NIES2101_21095 [Calothrix sp. HK-06]
MQEKLNRYIASCSPKAKSTFPYLHRAVSENESEKFINCSKSHKKMARSLQAIVTKTKFDTSDDALVALAYEYYRLASLAELNESNSQRMLMILSFAEIDVTLSNLINAIDAFLATEATLNDSTLFSSNVIVL